MADRLLPAHTRASADQKPRSEDRGFLIFRYVRMLRILTRESAVPEPVEAGQLEAGQLEAGESKAGQRGAGLVLGLVEDAVEDASPVGLCGLNGSGGHGGSHIVGILSLTLGAEAFLEVVALRSDDQLDGLFAAGLADLVLAVAFLGAGCFLGSDNFPIMAGSDQQGLLLTGLAADGAFLIGQDVAVFFTGSLNDGLITNGNPAVLFALRLGSFLEGRLLAALGAEAFLEVVALGSDDLVLKGLAAVRAAVQSIAFLSASGFNNSLFNVGMVQSFNNLMLEGLAAVGAAIQGVAFLVASGSNYDRLHVGMGANRIIVGVSFTADSAEAFLKIVIAGCFLTRILKNGTTDGALNLSVTSLTAGGRYYNSLHVVSASFTAKGASAALPVMSALGLLSAADAVAIIILMVFLFKLFVRDGVVLTGQPVLIFIICIA